MKVSPSIRKRCAKCKIVKRSGNCMSFAKTQSTNSDKDKRSYGEN